MRRPITGEYIKYTTRVTVSLHKHAHTHTHTHTHTLTHFLEIYNETALLSHHHLMRKWKNGGGWDITSHNLSTLSCSGPRTSFKTLTFSSSAHDTEAITCQLYYGTLGSLHPDHVCLRSNWYIKTHPFQEPFGSCPCPLKNSLRQPLLWNSGLAKEDVTFFL